MANVQAPVAIRSGSRLKKPSQKAIESESIQKRTRRTPAEVAHEKETIRLQREAKATDKIASIGGLAELEDRMAVKDAGIDQAHPRHYSGQCFLEHCDLWSPSNSLGKDISRGGVHERDDSDTETDRPPKKKHTVKAGGNDQAKKRKYEEPEEEITELHQRQRRKPQYYSIRANRFIIDAQKKVKQTGRQAGKVQRGLPKRLEQCHGVVVAINKVRSVIVSCIAKPRTEGYTRVSVNARDSTRGARHRTLPPDILNISDSQTDSDRTPPRKIG